MSVMDNSIVGTPEKPMLVKSNSTLASGHSMGGEQAKCSPHHNNAHCICSPNTVDMASFVGAIEASMAAGLQATDTKVPEGRKSFAARLSLRDNTSRNSLDTVSMSAQVEGMLSRVKNISSSPILSVPTVHRKPSGASLVLEGSGRFKAVKDEPMDSPNVLSHSPNLGPVLPMLSESRRRCSGDYSRSEQDSLQCSPLNEKSSPLPGNSSLQPIHHHGNSGHLRLCWDEFLSHCNVHLPPLEPHAAQAHVACTESMLPTVIPTTTPECPCIQRATQALTQKRTACLQRAVEELNERNDCIQQNYKASVNRWNQSTIMPPSAVELLQVLDNPQEIESFRNRIKSWQAFCKGEAWLKWYAAKHEWLVKDLGVAMEHTASLRREQVTMREVGGRLEETSQRINAALRQQRHLSDLKRSAQGLQNTESKEFQAVQDDRQFMRQKGSVVQGALQAERDNSAELERRIAEAKQRTKSAQSMVQDAQRNYLKQKAKRIALEQQRYSRTCTVAKSTATQVDLVFRGGARASVIQTTGDSNSFVTITFDPVVEVPHVGHKKHKITDTLPALGRELLTYLWWDLQATVPQCHRAQATPIAPPLAITVPSAEIPRLVRRLDCGTLRVLDQIRALCTLYKECSEVLDVAARLQDKNFGIGNSMLVVAVTLLIVRSHTLAGGINGGSAPLVPLCGSIAGSETHVDATKFILEFNADLAKFPDTVCWSNVTVQKVFGKGDAAEVQHVLNNQHVGNGNLAETISAAIEVMRHTAPGV